MVEWTAWIIPLLFCLILVAGAVRGVDVFETFLEGVREGLATTISLFPALLVLMATIGIFQSSGALDLLAAAFSPLANRLGLPVEVVPLALLRPLSGSGALVSFGHILGSAGPDSTTGRIASVLMGSTETTFYTIALYYGAAKITNTRHTLPSCLAADITGFWISAVAVRLFLR